MFFQPELGRACWICWACPLALGVGLLCKNKKQKGSAGARPFPLRCLSQFFPMKENINYLGNEVLYVSLRTFHLWGGLVFIMDDHDNFHNWIMILNSMFPSWMMTLNSMFPCWMMTLNNIFLCWRMIQYFSHWVRDFLSLS